MQVAVITGSNGLIGQATCRKLAQSGFLAVGIDIGPESKGNWPYYQCDLTHLDRMADTLAAIEKYGIGESISYISTGGGAFLEFVEGKKLPAVEILERRAA